MVSVGEIARTATKISKSTISVSVDAEATGDLAGFRWGGTTTDWMMDEQGSQGFSPLDFMPLTDCPAI